MARIGSKYINLDRIKELVEYYKEDYERAIGINFSTNASMETTIYDGGEDDAIAGCQAFEELYNDLRGLIGEEVQDV